MLKSSEITFEIFKIDSRDNDTWLNIYAFFEAPERKILKLFLFYLSCAILFIELSRHF